MDEGVDASERAIVERLLERVERQITAQRTRHPPANDPAGEHVDHERDVREAPPRRHVRQIGDPQFVRAGSPRTGA
jgi:hypothetical protein